MSRRRSRIPRADVTDAELAVMRVLWTHGSATVRAIADVLYPGGDAVHYGTVQKLLHRLAVKRCVARVRLRTPIEFAATVAQQALVDLRLQQVVDGLCAGSLTPVISHLAARRELTAAERNQLLRFIDELDRRAGKTGGGVGS